MTRSPHNKAAERAFHFLSPQRDSRRTDPTTHALRRKTKTQNTQPRLASIEILSNKKAIGGKNKSKAGTPFTHSLRSRTGGIGIQNAKKSKNRHCRSTFAALPISHISLTQYTVTHFHFLSTTSLLAHTLHAYLLLPASPASSWPECAFRTSDSSDWECPPPILPPASAPAWRCRT